MFSLKPKSSSPSDTAELRSSKRFEVNQRVLIRSLDAASAGCHGVITNVSERGMRIRSDDSQFSPNDPVQIEWRGKQIFGIVRNSLDRDSTSYLGIKVYHSWDTFTEDVIAAHALELSRRNQDMRSLTQSAAHEAHDHLSTMVIHIELTLRNKTLDADTRNYLDRALDSAGKLRGFVKELQELSFLGNEGVVYEDVNCHQLIGEIRAKLRTGGSPIVLTNDWLPTVPADQTKLQSVFEKVVDACLAVDEGSYQSLHVSAEETSSDMVFAFRRNGFSTGLLVQQTDRPAGAGQIGMAIAEKIVEQHSGRIWKEFHKTHGTVFYVSLPKTSARPGEAICDHVPADGPRVERRQPWSLGTLCRLMRNAWRPAKRCRLVPSEV